MPFPREGRVIGMTLSLGIAKAVILDETFPLRFEKFCADLVSKIEGGTHIVVTSANYDQGRDGVRIGQGPKVIVCCSLADEVDSKAESDAKKLARTTKSFDRIYFCSSQKLTEFSSDRLEAKIKKLTSFAGDVTVLGVEKLGAFASQWDSILRHHYPSEVSLALKSLSDPDPEDHETHSLRLALSISGSSDAASIRRSIWSSAIRLSLSSGTSKTPNEISAFVSNYLRLGRALSGDSIQRQVALLVEAGHVLQIAPNSFVISPDGVAALELDNEAAAAATLTGRTAFREEISARTETKISESQSNKMWASIQDTLATLFYNRGREIVQMIEPILATTSSGQSNASKPLPAPDAQSLHRDLFAPIARAASHGFTHRQQREEVETAVLDLLRDGNGPAVEWLSRACFAFICACSLGIEPRTQAALESILSRTTLVLDTDVIISFLSPDEPLYETTRSLTRQWREAGGRIILSQEVLKEVAHHAWNAKIDYEHIGDVLPANTTERRTLSRNAFVRGFGKLLESGEATPSEWPQWIRQFRGNSLSDISQVRNHLHGEWKFGELPSPNREFRVVSKDVEAYIERKHTSETSYRPWDDRDDFIWGDKARRDASLFASLLQANQAGTELGEDRHTYLVTSSGRFRDVESKFRTGESSLVLSVPAASYMLSLTPGRPLGLSALRAFLFDSKWQERLSDFQLLALRVVKRSSSFKMNWAKRGALLRELRRSVESEARERTPRNTATRDAVESVEREWTESGGRDGLSKALAKALDEVAVPMAMESELDAARKRIKELEEELQKRR